MPRKGQRMPQSAIEKIRKSKLGKKRPEITGSLNPHWAGDNISDKGGRLRAWNMYPCPPGKERHHIDGNPKNNDPSNIEFLTHKEHMIKDGRLEKWKTLNKTRERTFSQSGLSNLSLFAKKRSRGIHGYFLPQSTLVKKAVEQQ